MKKLISFITLTTFLAFHSVAEAQQPRLGISVSIPIDFSSSQKQLGEIEACKIANEHLNGYGHRVKKEKPSYLSQVLDVVVASLVFAGLDFAFFQWLSISPNGTKNYRIFQGSLQTALSVALFYRNGGPEQWKEGLKVAGAFNLLWWTFNADLIYYGMAEIGNPGAFNNDAKPDGWGMRHAWWTPYGLYRTVTGENGFRDNVISKDAIITQALIGQGLTAGLLALDFWDDPEQNIKDLQEKIKKLDIKRNRLQEELEKELKRCCQEFPDPAPSNRSIVYLPHAFPLESSIPAISGLGSSRNAIDQAFDRAFAKPGK